MKKKQLFTASVIALSAVAPAVAAAQTSFQDVSDTSAHAAAISQLVERGVVNGYADGTFKPNAALTRGQAAKILANILKLDTTDTTQKFSDVPATHEFAGTIHALAKEGIVSGYADGTFKPNATLTRGQMAKVIVKAFKLVEASSLDLPFTDVAASNGYSYYIQTLLNYEITLGTSASTFAPHEGVKRGQMASFVVRAESVGKDKPVETPSTGGNAGNAGGTPSTGGSTGNTGETPSTGGNAGNAGGTPSTGGNTGNTGETPSTGGSTGNTGETPSAGGSTGNTGGTPSTGGSTGNTGGTPSAGGNTGNTGGTPSAGGSTGNTGGTPSTGGNTGNTGEQPTNPAIEVATGKPVVTGETVTLAGKTYQVGNFKSFLEAAKDAEVKVELDGDKIVGIQDVKLQASADNTTFDGKGYTIKGSLTVAGTGDMTVSNLTVNGSTKVATQLNDVKFNRVTVAGEVTTYEAPQTRNSIRASIQGSVDVTETRIKITFENSQVAYITVTHSASVSLASGTTVKSVSVQSDSEIFAAKGIILPTVKIEKGATEVVLNATIASVEIESTGAVAVSGSGNFKEVKVATAKPVEIKTTGTIGALASDNQSITLGTDVKVGETKNAKGEQVAPDKLIANHDKVKEQVNVTIDQEQFKLYLAAKFVPNYERYGYGTLDIVNDEGQTIKYRFVPAQHLQASVPIKKGEKAPADLATYKKDEELLFGVNTKLEVYKVDAQGVIMDSFVVESNNISVYDYVVDGRTVTVQMAVNPAYYEQEGRQLKVDAIHAVNEDGVYVIKTEGIQGGFNKEGLYEFTVMLPADFKYDKDMYAQLYIMTNWYGAGPALGRYETDAVKLEKYYVTTINHIVKTYEEKNLDAGAVSLHFLNAMSTFGYQGFGHSTAFHNLFRSDSALPIIIKELTAKDLSTKEKIYEALTALDEKYGESISLIYTLPEKTRQLLDNNRWEKQGAEKLAPSFTLAQYEEIKSQYEAIPAEIQAVMYMDSYNELTTYVERYVTKTADLSKVYAAFEAYEAIDQEAIKEYDVHNIDNAYRQLEQRYKWWATTVEELNELATKLEKAIKAATLPQTVVEAVAVNTAQSEIVITFSEAMQLTGASGLDYFLTSDSSEVIVINRLVNGKQLILKVADGASLQALTKFSLYKLKDVYDRVVSVEQYVVTQ